MREMDIFFGQNNQYETLFFQKKADDVRELRMGRSDLVSIRMQVEEFEKKFVSKTFELLDKLGLVAKAPSLKNVLILDDSAIIRQLMTRFLDSIGGIRTIEVATPEEALEVFKKKVQVNLVFLDVALPTMNGIEFLEILHSKPELSHIPVVMLTGKSDPTLVLKAKRFGIKGWIIKPPRMEQIQKIIKTLT
jgi:CheY-like chemotaxis protein